MKWFVFDLVDVEAFLPFLVPSSLSKAVMYSIKSLFLLSPDLCELIHEHFGPLNTALSLQHPSLNSSPIKNMEAALGQFTLNR